LAHLECNPQMLRYISNQGGLHFHESEVQMGLPQSDLFPLPKSFQTAASSHTRRVLPSLRLQPQIRHSAAQRSRATKTQAKLQRPSRHLRGEGRLGSCGHLGGGWLSVLGAPQSAPTVMAPLGYQALRDLGPSQKQLLSISPSTIHRRLKPKKRQLKKRLYGRTKHCMCSADGSAQWRRFGKVRGMIKLR
jgi:hypothetical protein